MSMSHRRPILLLILSASLLVTACGWQLPGAGPTATPLPTRPPEPRPAVEPPSAVQTWYEAARSEGEVKVYADVSIRETQEIDRLFGERFPEVKVSWTRGLDRELLARCLAEARDGGSSFDVFIGDLGTHLNGAGLAERWSPPESPALPPEWIDQEGAWYGVATTYHVMQYHTEQVPPTARPGSYEALAHPWLTGRLAIEEQPLGWLKGMIESRGRQPTVDLLRELAGQAVAMRRSPQILADSVSAGQIAIAITNRLDAVERNKRGGAKTGWIAIEPVIVQPTALVLSARAPHPNAARLFANFLLTADAQVLLAEQGRIPARFDVDPEPQSLVKGLQTYFTVPAEGAAERELRELFVDVWRAR
jgi:iron(III) transport system substrate-binding protein